MKIKNKVVTNLFNFAFDIPNQITQIEAFVNFSNLNKFFMYHKKKILITFIFWMFTFHVFSQEKNPCDKLYSAIGSLAIGGSAVGPVENIEAGLWGRKNNIGILGGIMLYNGQEMKQKISTFTTPLVSELYIRPIYKLDHKLYYDYGFHNAVSLFIGTKGNYGVSYRGYYQVSSGLMFGLEPIWTFKTGDGINFLTTFAF